MDITQMVSLATLQGLTEFLPISSSAHLILLPIFANWKDQGLAFDIALHVGTLTAVIIYFRRTLKTLLTDWIESIYIRETIGNSRLVWGILVGTIPIGLVGLILGDLVEIYLRSPLLIAITTIIFGLLLGWADLRGEKQRNEHQLTWKNIIIVGIAQVVALIPGTSRSGITITAGLLLGLNRNAAARFSFLLSIPVIILAGGLKTFELIYTKVGNTDWLLLISSSLFAAISAYSCIHLFFILINKIGMWPFVIYRLVLGAILIKFFI